MNAVKLLPGSTSRCYPDQMAAAQTSAPFGGSSFGGAFGQSSAGSVFGQASSPSLFGTSSTPAFGSSSSSYGAGGSIFGQQQQQSAPAFGQSPLGASSAAASSPFTFNTGGAFGTSSTPSLFGTGLAFGASSSPAFGQTGGGGIFGQQAAKPAFGGGGGLFGGQQSTPAFGLSQSQPAFGGGGGIFGQASSPGLGGGLFGGQNTFNFSPQGGQQQPQAQQQFVPAQPLGELMLQAYILRSQCSSTVLFASPSSN